MHRTAWPTQAEIETALGGPAAEGREATASRHASVTANSASAIEAKLGFSAAVDVVLTVPEDISSSWPLIELRSRGQ